MIHSYSFIYTMYAYLYTHFVSDNFSSYFQIPLPQTVGCQYLRKLMKSQSQPCHTLWSVPWLFRKLWIVFSQTMKNWTLSISILFPCGWRSSLVTTRAAVAIPMQSMRWTRVKTVPCLILFILKLDKCLEMIFEFWWILHLCLPSHPTPLSQMISILGGVWMFASWAVPYKTPINKS